MLAPHDRLRRNEEDVVAKVMDGEAVIINLANGMYYSMDQVGGVIWTMVEAGYSLAEMVDALTATHAVSPEQAQADVERLAAELVHEHLVTVADGPGSPRPQAPAAHTKLPYAPPVLNIYRDMGDLLALDPPMPRLKDVPWKDPSDGSSGS